MTSDTTRSELVEYLKNKRDALVTQAVDEAQEAGIRSQFGGFIAALDAGEAPDGLVEVLDDDYSHWCRVEADTSISEGTPTAESVKHWKDIARYEQERITRWLQELEPATN